jgi:hypothetical protein
VIESYCGHNDVTARLKWRGVKNNQTDQIELSLKKTLASPKNNQK